MPLRHFSNLDKFNMYPLAESLSGIYKQVFKSFKDYDGLTGHEPLNNNNNLASVYFSLLSSRLTAPKVYTNNPLVDFGDVWKEFYSFSSSLESQKLWYKVIHDILPVRQRLFRFHIVSNPRLSSTEKKRKQSSIFSYLVAI